MVGRWSADHFFMVQLVHNYPSLQVSSKTGQVLLSSSLTVESCHSNYIHEECSYWFEYFRSRRKEHSGRRVEVMEADDK